ncbi:MAG: nucleotide exchange factor GrpE [Myxococcota bacterium]
MNTSTKKASHMPCEKSLEEAKTQQEIDPHQKNPATTGEPSTRQNQAPATDQPQQNEITQESKQPPVQEQMDPLQQLQQKLDTLNDQYLRLAAEFDNYKRRSRQQTQQQLQYANEPLARQLLPCLDHLQQALHAGQQALEKTDHPSLHTLLDGIDMVHKQLLETLQRFGIHCLQPVGQPFDPNRHEAVSQQEDDQTAPGTVLQQLQAGYMLHERLLRPAKVIVAQAKETEKN